MGTHPIRLGLALNYSVFQYEVLQNPDEACKMHARLSRMRLRSSTTSKRTLTKTPRSSCSCCATTSRSGRPTRRGVSLECHCSRPQAPLNSAGADFGDLVGRVTCNVAR